jgi:hypothetical protein
LSKFLTFWGKIACSDVESAEKRRRRFAGCKKQVEKIAPCQSDRGLISSRTMKTLLSLAVALALASTSLAGGHRSSSARRAFMKQTGYPHGRSGYVIDHVVPLKRGGADAPSNMQWQTKAEAKAKDKWE